MSLTPLVLPSLLQLVRLPVLFLVSLPVRSVVCADECTRINACSCRTTAGGVIDISKLGSIIKSSYPHGLNAIDPFYPTTNYDLNPCFTFTESSSQCTDVLVCQHHGEEDWDIGSQSVLSPSFTFDDFFGDLEIIFLAKDISSTRVSKLVCHCDPSATGLPSLTSDGEEISSTGSLYTFRMDHQCCCPGGCEKGPDPVPPYTPSSGLSTGSILLILFFVFVIIYCIGGFVFLKYRRGATGTDVIPNASWWASLPGLVKDGAGFVVAKCRQTGAGYREIG